MKVSLVPACLFLFNITCSSAFVVPKTTLKPKGYYRQNVVDRTAVKAFPDGVMKTASAATDSMTSSPLFSYFLETLIAYAVPTFFAIVTIGFAAVAFSKNRDREDAMGKDSVIAELYNDLYGESQKGMGGFPFQKPSKTKLKNLGIPTSEYLKITNLNEKLDSYDFSIAKATKSKAFAAAQYRSKSFDRALQLSLAGTEDLPAYAKARLLEKEKEFLRKGGQIVVEIQRLEQFLAAQVIDQELKSMGVEKLELDPKPIDAVIESKNNVTVAKNETSAAERTMPKSKMMKEVSKLQRELNQLELGFVQDIISAVGPERAIGVRAALLADIGGRGIGGLLTQLEERPLSAILQSSETDGTEKKSLYVMNFPGDVTASQLNGLREEVTAIVRNAKPGDEALVVLQSGGGTVTGYGLAAGQLVRLKEKGLFLTIAVEQVAASGGYMMTCVADRIVASPFAVLGSIGVISEIPNVYQRLKDEGM